MQRIMEKWRDIPGFEGYYEGSTLGRIRRRDFNRFFIPDCRRGGVRLIKPRDTKRYWQAVLYKNGVRHVFGWHNLIADTFPEICGEHLPGYEVNHLNEDKTDNRAENLRYVPKIINLNWGTRNKRIAETQTNREDCSKTIQQFTLCGEFIGEYPSTMEIQRQFGYHHGHISKCCKGKLKTAYGYVWKYKTLPN